jgi:hypothetical protein
LSTPQPPIPATPDSADATFTAQLLATLKNPEVADAVAAAAERAQMRWRQPPTVDAGHFAKRA